MAKPIRRMSQINTNNQQQDVKEINNVEYWLNIGIETKEFGYLRIPFNSKGLTGIPLDSINESIKSTKNKDLNSEYARRQNILNIIISELLAEMEELEEGDEITLDNNKWLSKLKLTIYRKSNSESYEDNEIDKDALFDMLA